VPLLIKEEKMYMLYSYVTVDQNSSMSIQKGRAISKKNMHQNIE